MPEQLSFPGVDPAPRPTNRFFFGIFPDSAVAAQIRELAVRLRTENCLRGNPLATDRFHSTLHHIGDYGDFPHDMIRRAQEAAATLKAAPFEVTFDRAASFSRPRNLPFVLLGREGVATLIAFQRSLFEALKRVSIVQRGEPNFTPHVTLLYDDRNVLETAVEPIRWTVREFVLIHSLIGQTRHIPLARWPLLG